MPGCLCCVSVGVVLCPGMTFAEVTEKYSEKTSAGASFRQALHRCGAQNFNFVAEGGRHDDAAQTATRLFCIQRWITHVMSAVHAGASHVDMFPVVPFNMCPTKQSPVRRKASNRDRNSFNPTVQCNNVESQQTTGAISVPRSTSLSAILTAGFQGLKSWSYPRFCPSGAFNCFSAFFQNTKKKTEGTSKPQEQHSDSVKKSDNKAEGTPKPQDQCSECVKKNFNKAEGTPKPQEDPEDFEGFECKVFQNHAAFPWHAFTGSVGSHELTALSTSPPRGSPLTSPVSSSFDCHGSGGTTASNSKRAHPWNGDSSLVARGIHVGKFAVFEARTVRGQRVLGLRGLSCFRRRSRNSRRLGRAAQPRAFASYKCDFNFKSALAEPLPFAENLVSQLVGRGRKKPKQNSPAEDALLSTLRVALQKYADAGNDKNSGPTPEAPLQPKDKQDKKKKDSLRGALSRLLERPPSGRPLLNKLASLLRAAEAGHLLLEDSRQERAQENVGPNPNPKSEVGPPNPNPKAKAKSILKKPTKPLTDIASNLNPLAEFSLHEASCSPH